MRNPPKKDKIKDLNSPVPVRMYEYKELYREEANKLDRPMQWVLFQAIKAYAKNFTK